MRKIRKTITLAVLSLTAMLAVTSCDAPGRQSVETAVIRPADIADFRLLYSQNCSGCHGANGQGALTVGIGRPVYLAIADDATIRKTIEEGRPGTPMPAFAQKAGGMLTDAQIDILVHGIRGWANAKCFREYKASGLRSRSVRRCHAGGRIVQGFLRSVSRSGRPRRARYRRLVIPGFGQRSASPHRDHCWHAQSGYAGLAQPPQTADRCRRGRSCRVAHRAAGTIVSAIKTLRYFR